MLSYRRIETIPVCVKNDASMRDAIEKMNANSRGCFVSNNYEALVGCITDGDIRRSLLVGHELDTVNIL